MIEFGIDLAWNGGKVWKTLIARLGAVLKQDISKGMLTALLGIYRESGWTIRGEGLVVVC